MDFDKKSKRRGKDITFYLSFDVIKTIKEESNKAGLSQSKYLENLVVKAKKHSIRMEKIMENNKLIHKYMINSELKGE